MNEESKDLATAADAVDQAEVERHVLALVDRHVELPDDHEELARLPFEEAAVQRAIVRLLRDREIVVATSVVSSVLHRPLDAAILRRVPLRLRGRTYAQLARACRDHVPDREIDFCLSMALRRLVENGHLRLSGRTFVSGDENYWRERNAREAESKAEAERVNELDMAAAPAVGPQVRTRRRLKQRVRWFEGEMREEEEP